MSALERVKSWFRHFDLFALGPSALAFYALIFFCVPLLNALGVRFGFILNGKSPALQPLFYLFLGFVFLALGYYAVPTRQSRYIADFFRRPWDEVRTKIIFAAGFGIGLSMKVIRIIAGAYSHLDSHSALQTGPFFSGVGFLEEFAYLALAIASVKQARAETAGEKKFWGWALGLSLGAELLYAVPSCARLGIFVPLLIWLISCWYSGQRSYVSLGILSVLMILIFPFGNFCRTPSTWFGSYAPGAPSGGAGATAYVSDSSFSRIDQEKVFAAILTHPTPLLYGRFIRDIAVSLGPPRFIWKSKPAIAAGGNELGRRLGVLAPTDIATSIGPTLPGDWYMNFGLAGLIIGMVLMGMLWRFVYVNLISPTGFSLAGTVLYVLVWIQTIRGIEDSIAPVYAGLIKFTVVFLLIALFAQKNRIQFKLMNFIQKIDNFLRPRYHHIRLFLWAFYKFPAELSVADTNTKLLIHNWPAAALLKVDTTKVENGKMFYEPTEYSRFLAMIKDKKTFYDVGAFVGWYSLVAASHGATNIVAFEIIPELAEMTKKHFALNAIKGNVICAPVGRGGEHSSYHSNLVASSGQAISLDEYAEKHNLWPDAIKMDIEGAEYDALLGAQKVLSRKPALDISVHTEFLQERGHSAQEVLDMLAGYGYKTVWSGGDTYFME